MMKRQGSLDAYSNQDTEAENKLMLAILNRSQHNGALGRTSKATREHEESTGIPLDHTYGTSPLDHTYSLPGVGAEGVACEGGGVEHGQRVPGDAVREECGGVV